MKASTAHGRNRRTLWIFWLAFAASSLAAAADLRLLEAVRAGDKQAARALLSQRVDANEAAADGATALHWAAQRDDLETTDLLIRAGANVNTANDYGVTPLALACVNRSAAMVEKLLGAGANPNAAKVTGETVLMTCSRTGSVETVRALLARGADPNASEARGGQTALMWALAGKHSTVAGLLIERGANVNARSKTRSGLEIAVRYGTGGVADQLPYREPKGGFTPLLFAAQQGDRESLRMLLAAGANINDAAPEDGTALAVASASGQEELAIYLLERGADANIADGFGVTPLHYALGKGMATLLGIRFDPSYRVHPPNMPDLAKALLARGANANARVTRGYKLGPDGIPFSMVGTTPFFLAAASADASLMRILAAAGANPRLPSNDGSMPLMAAAMAACSGTCAYAGANRDNEEDARNALEAVKAAVDAGVDVNAVNSDGQTAMHAAAFTGSDAIVQFLADHGANVDVRDKTGETPWTMAAGVSPTANNQGLYGVHKSTADLLLKLGAKQVTREEMLARRGARPAPPEPSSQPVGQPASPTR
ncbi:MAG: ankyrin-related protein [Acidobacteria bacterium]|nr:ankyrin-related protein [Acidobacteriota bacterium]